MQRSRQELEAAVLYLMRERAWQINKNPKYRELWSVELVEAIELAVTILRETEAGMDGFEAWKRKHLVEAIDEFDTEYYSSKRVADCERAYLAGRASASADVDALADEVERRDTYWNREKRQYEDPMLTCPQRVRDILAARRKEGK